MFRSLQIPNRGTFKTESKSMAPLGFNLITCGGGVSMQGNTTFQPSFVRHCSRSKSSGLGFPKLVPARNIGLPDPLATFSEK